MAKGITLKTKNGATGYPKSVTDLIFDNATGKTLKTLIEELKAIDAATDTRTQYYKASVTDLDALNAAANIGTYNYVGNGWRGLVQVCLDHSSNVAQVALSSSSPSYDGNVLSWLAAQPCSMARVYRNGAWSHWEKVGAPVVNDLTTGGTDKALSAEMGKTLKEGLDALGPKIDEIDEQINGNGTVTDSASISSPNWTAKQLSKIIPSGAKLTQIEGTFSGTGYLGDSANSQKISIKTNTSLPIDVNFDIYVFTCSPTSNTITFHFEVEGEEGILMKMAEMTTTVESIEGNVATLSTSVDAVSEAVLGKEEVIGSSSVSSPNWTAKALSSAIPSGASLTAISPSISQFYLYDANGNQIIGALSPNLMPITLTAEAVTFSCSPTSETVTLTYKIAGVEGMQGSIDRIEGLANDNADEIEAIKQQISGSSSDYEILSYRKLDSSFNVVSAANSYDKVVKVKCEGGTKYAISTDYRVNAAMYAAEVAFFNSEDELISGSEVTFRTPPAYRRNLNGFIFETPANTSYVIASLSNVNVAGTVVYCDKYDNLNKTSESNALSIWVLGDSISATAYQTGILPYKTNATASYGVGGWINEFLVQVSRRPIKWYNFASGGWFLGGEPVAGSKSFSLELENAITAYGNETIDAPDIILSVGCTNDFDYTSHQVTDSDLQGESYNEYMERNFMTVVNDNTRTLIPIADVNKVKLAGAMRYIVERAGTLFPNCKFVFCTPSQSTLHNPVNQMRCVNEMKWMAARLCVPIIDVWCEAQMPMLWDYYDADGTEHHKFLDDRVHTYNTGGGSNAIGWQRQGQYIARRFSEIFRKEMGLDY